MVGGRGREPHRLVAWHAPRYDVVAILAADAAVCTWASGPTAWAGQVGNPVLVADLGYVGVWQVEAPDEWCDLVATLPTSATSAPCPYVSESLAALPGLAGEIGAYRHSTHGGRLPADGTLDERVIEALLSASPTGADATCRAWYVSVLRSEAMGELPRAALASDGTTNFAGVESFGSNADGIHDLWDIAACDVVAGWSP